MLLSAGLFVLLALGVVLYLNFADLSGWCDVAADMATEALGREIEIAGVCRPDVGFPTRLLIEDLSVANPPWSSEPEMIRVDRFAVTLSLWSFVDRPIFMSRIRLEGARLVLEASASEGGNWELGTAEEDLAKEVEEGGVPLVVDDVEITDLEVVYRENGEVVADLGIDKLVLRQRPTGMIHLDGGGSLSGESFDVAGELGPFAELLRAGQVSGDLELELLDSQLSLVGGFSDLASYTNPEFEVAVQGRDLDRVTTSLGLPNLGGGEFRLAGKLSGPSLEAEVELSLDVVTDLIEAQVEGHLGSPLEPASATADVSVSGPDLRAVGAVVQRQELPVAPFEISGDLAWSGEELTFREIVGAVGANALSLDGTLRLADSGPDFDVAFSVEGPDLSTTVELADLELPRAPFGASGSARTVDSGLEIDQLEARLGSTSLVADGRLGLPPGKAASELEVRLASGDLSELGWLARVGLPATPVDLGGHIALAEGVVSVRSLGVELGPPEALHRGAFTGDFVLEAPFSGSSMVIELQGPNLAELLAMVPSEMPQLPAVTYRVGGTVGVDDAGYSLEGVEAAVGGESATLDGRLGFTPELEGTDLEIDFRSAALDELAAHVQPFYELPSLPGVPLAISGRVTQDDGVYGLDGLNIELGASRLLASGSVGPFPGLSRMRLAVDLAVPDVARLAGYLSEADLVDLSRLPVEELASAGPLSLAGEAAVLDDGYGLESVVVGLGDIELRVNGQITSQEGLAGTDLTLVAGGPDAAILGSLAAMEMPAEPFHLEGRLVRDVAATRLASVAANLGDVELSLQGVVGDPPTLADSDVRLSVAGPRSLVLSSLLDTKVPRGEFSLEAHFAGSAERFSIDDLVAKLGRSDLKGSIEADLRDVPDVDVLLRSERIDLPQLLGLVDEAVEPVAPQAAVEAAAAADGEVAPGADTPASPTEATAEEVAADAAELLFADDPLAFDFLRSFEGDLDVRIGALGLPTYDLLDVNLDVELHDGALRVLPTSVVGPNGGTLSLSLDLAPSGDGYRLDTRVRGDDLRVLDALNTAGEGDIPTLDLDIDLVGAGATPHALMAAADGVLILEVNPGLVNAALLDLIGGNVLSEVFGAFTPGSGGAEDTTEMECVVALGDLESGVMKIQPMILRTGRTDIVGKGRVDFETEALDLEWQIKARKGLGLSLGALTESAVKLGGTLAAPKLEITPLDTALKVGAATATGGLSLLLDRVWSRIASKRDRCKKSLEKAQEVRREFRGSGR